MLSSSTPMLGGLSTSPFLGDVYIPPRIWPSFLIGERCQLFSSEYPYILLGINYHPTWTIDPTINTLSQCYPIDVYLLITLRMMVLQRFWRHISPSTYITATLMFPWIRYYEYNTISNLFYLIDNQIKKIHRNLYYRYYIDS